MTWEITDNYIKEINQAYWEEHDEMKIGIHPSQIKEKIEEVLKDSGLKSFKITFLDWNYDGYRVGVYVDDKFYGIYDYNENLFQSSQRNSK